jgi:dTDP-4-dehydrorhamnose reductase
MKLLVTGAAGGVGRAFTASAPAHHQVVAFDHASLDIGDHDAVMHAVTSVGPDAILNFAAFTDVDGNEIDPGRAARDNSMGPQNLALAARECRSWLLHVSTDYVFDGTKGAPYDEIDEPAPMSAYGRAKLAGEEQVRSLIDEHLIVRVGYVFGSGSDYMSRSVKALAAGEPAAGIKDAVGTPTFVADIAHRLIPLLLTRRWGTYHLASPTPCSWFDFLSRTKEIGGLSGDVRSQSAAELRRPAPRPANSSLTSLYMPHLDVAPMPELDDAIERFLQALP